MKKWMVVAACLYLSGCASVRQKVPFLGKRDIWIGGVYKENMNFDLERMVDLTLVKKLTGKKLFGIFNRYNLYLEGYIRGVVVDYDDTPMEGIVVRVVDKGKDLPGYDPGISDSNGVYRIRLSLPVKKKKVDVRGAIAYNPPWQQQLDVLGAALEPQTKETKFRLYYDKKIGMIAIGEDIPKTITRRVSGALKETKVKEEKEKKDKAQEKKTTPNAPSSSGAKQKSEDFFGGFGDFGKE